MSTPKPNAKAIFLEAVEKHSPDQWPMLLDQKCGDDRVLRDQVEQLLAAHQKQDSLFDRTDATSAFRPAEHTGEMIGDPRIPLARANELWRVLRAYTLKPPVVTVA